MIGYISQAFVFIIGGVLFQINNKLPAFASLPLLFAAFIATFFLVDPYHVTGKIKTSHSINHLKKSVSLFLKSPELKFLFIYYLPVAAVCTMILNLSSLYLELVKIPIYLIGVVAFVTSMLSAFSSRKADAIDSLFGEKMSLVVAQIILMISLFLLSFMIPYWGMLFYLLVPLSLGFVQVSVSHRLNVLVSSKHRATMLSINNLGGNLGMFLFFPIAGFFARTMSMSFAMIFLLGLLIVGVFVLVLFKYLVFSKK